MKTKMNYLISCLVAVLMFNCLPVYSQEKETQIIYEKVKVVNTEMIFRAVKDGKTVGNLKKEDFKLYIDGKERDINGFFEFSKKIKIDSSSPASVSETKNVSPRLFVLLFNISDYQIDLNSSVNYFFDNVAKGNDRLIVLSNSFFLNDHVISSVDEEKQKLEKMIDFEIRKNRKLNVILRNSLQSLLNQTNELMKEMGDEGIDPEIVRQNFIESYNKYLKEYRSNYVNLSNEQMVKLADYLRHQSIDKWVLNFYQNENYYLPAANSFFDRFLSDSPLYLEMKQELNEYDSSREDEISRYFINSGATIHSIFMPPKNMQPVGNDVSTTLGLERRKIVSGYENILAKITKLTGGVSINGNNADVFFKTQDGYQEDIYYMLTFVPEEKNKKETIKLVGKNPDLKLIYNDMQKSELIKHIIAENDNFGHIKLNEVKIQDGVLSFIIDHSGFSKNGSSRAAKIHIQFINEQMQPIFNRSKNFQLQMKQTPINVKIPVLKKGSYGMLLEVVDLSTEKNDICFKEFSWPK